MKIRIDIKKDLIDNLSIKKSGIFNLIGKAITTYEEEYKTLNKIINLKSIPNIKEVSKEILKEAYYKERKEVKATLINIDERKKILIEEIIGEKNFINNLLINQPIKVRSYIIEETLKLYNGEDNAILKIKRELERLKQEQENSNNPEPNKTKEEPVKEKPEEKKSDGGIDLSNIIVF